MAARTRRRRLSMHRTLASDRIRFLTGGILNTALSYTIYFLLQLLFEYRLAYTIAFAAGIVAGYATNTWWVFRKPWSWRAVLAYPAVPVASYFASLLIVHGVTLHYMPRFSDMRGALSVGDFAKDLPFAPQRYFLVFDVPTQETRGEYTHRGWHQLLLCVHGSVRVLADDGTHRGEYTLDSPSTAIHLPPMTWRTQYRYSRDAVLLVFASEAYDGDEYIGDYDAFLAEVRSLR